MLKESFIKCIQVTYVDRDPDSYGRYIKRSIVWLKSEEIVKIEMNKGYIYDNWKDIESTEPVPLNMVNLLLRNGKELSVVYNEEFEEFSVI